MLRPMKITRRNALKSQALSGLSLLGLPMVPASASAAGAMAEPPPGPKALPLRVSAALPDVAELAAPSAVMVGGWLGERIRLNAKVRLLGADMEPMLEGFRKKPGSHPWIGEHVGKWMHAATLAWANNSDMALRAKLDRVAADLIAAQEADGYLGTYTPEFRLGLTRTNNDDWDVWSHKYCLIGLLTYYRFTGNAVALEASKKAADLLLATFPAKRSILEAGTHMGMAATSVLEPMVLLYRVTGDKRYLAFAQYIVTAWDEKDGPAIVKSLLKDKQVSKVANAKAYEMLSNLVGLAELARVTGDQTHLQATLLAWQDVVDRRLYLTGGTSQYEHFQADHDTRDDTRAHVSETCVTTTWIQLNLVLLQLTGEARFAEELERSFYNQLAAAQHPQGDDWCYFTPLSGRKQYDKYITCCHSSGPRGMALAPLAAYLRNSAGGHDTLLVNTFETSRATLVLGGQSVTVEQESGFPYRGGSTLTLRMAKSAHFALKVRAAQWAQPVTLAGASVRDGWVELPARTWKDGDVLPIQFRVASRVNPGEHTNAGRAALSWGPFVLAYEKALNPGLPGSHLLRLPSQARLLPPTAGQPLSFEAEAPELNLAQAHPGHRARFLTFADAGTNSGLFRIWMRSPNADVPGPNESLLIGGKASSSRAGAGGGAINDEDFESMVTTRDGRLADEDWFAVTLDHSVSAQRVVFTHGKNAPDGGWFDTSAGKPRVQVQRSAGSPWETVGTLDEYPEATSSDAKHVEWWSRDAQFTLRLKAPVRFVALRVVGKPASGKNPAQAFVSCAELQAFSA